MAASRRLAAAARRTLAAAMTTWATFAPCFLWNFLGAPYLERLRHHRHHRQLIAALSAGTAAVVEVILKLAVWFSWHLLWPATGRFDAFAAVLAAIAFAGLVR